MKNFRIFLNLFFLIFVCAGICYYNYMYIDFGSIICVTNSINIFFNFICISSVTSLILSVFTVVDNIVLKKKVCYLEKCVDEFYENTIDYIDLFIVIITDLHKELASKDNDNIEQ